MVRAAHLPSSQGGPLSRRTLAQNAEWPACSANRGTGVTAAHEGPSTSSSDWPIGGPRKAAPEASSNFAIRGAALPVFLPASLRPWRRREAATGGQRLLGFGDHPGIAPKATSCHDSGSIDKAPGSEAEEAGGVWPSLAPPRQPGSSPRSRAWAQPDDWQHCFHCGPEPGSGPACWYGSRTLIPFGIRGCWTWAALDHCDRPSGIR